MLVVHAHLDEDAAVGLRRIEPRELEAVMPAAGQREVETHGTPRRQAAQGVEQTRPVHRRDALQKRAAAEVGAQRQRRGVRVDDVEALVEQQRRPADRREDRRRRHAERRDPQTRGGRHLDPPVQTLQARIAREQVVVPEQALGTADQQAAAGPQRGVQGAQRAALGGRFEHREQIAAADQVEREQRCRRGQLVQQEDGALGEHARDFAVVAAGAQIAAAQRLGHPLRGVEQASARLRQRFDLAVAAVDDKLQRGLLSGLRLRDQHRQHPGLLAGPAAGHPDLRSRRVRQQRGQQPLQRVGHLGVAEQQALRQLHVARQEAGLVGILTDALGVLLDPRDLQQAHAARDTPQHRGALEQAEVDPVQAELAVDRGIRGVEPAGVDSLRRWFAVLLGHAGHPCPRRSRLAQPLPAFAGTIMTPLGGLLTEDSAGRGRGQGR